MHILFIGYGQTSQRVAKKLWQQGHRITAISRTPKPNALVNHLVQDVHHLNLTQLFPIDCVYILLSPQERTMTAYEQIYLATVPIIIAALKSHPIQKIILLSSTRVYGEQQGQYIDDTTKIQPSDLGGEILRQMELCYLNAFPKQTIVVRPSGIYGTSLQRMLNLAKNTQTYPAIHWTNRIHLDDLVQFLVDILVFEQPESSYLLSSGQHVPLHEIIMWFQKQLNLPILSLQSQQQTGKRMIPTHLQQMGFNLQHTNCFEDYLALLENKNLSEERS